MRYPVLTVRQMYAALLALGIKDIENRSQPFPRKLLGKTILIHAAKQWHGHFKGRTTRLQKFQNMILHAALRSHFTAGEILSKWEAAPHVTERGGIVGAMRVTSDGQDTTCSTWVREGYKHWQITDARPVPFHSCTGRLGIWYLDYPHEVRLPDA